MKSARRSTRAVTPAVRCAEPEAVTIPAYASTLDGFRRWAHSDEFPREKVSSIGGKIFVELAAEMECVVVPAHAHTLEGFRRWSNSKDFPQRGQIFFLDGEIYIDMSPERIETHNYIKTEITRVLATLVREQNSGAFYSDRARLVNKAAKVSNEPDAFFAYFQTLKSNALRIVPSSSKHGDGIDIEGTPDWVLEIVGPYSEKKDTRTLRDRYYHCGIPEYWLIDARKQLSFQILVHGPDGYIAQKKQGGWLYSPVFGCRFRLTRERNCVGHWQYDLHVGASTPHKKS
jgi:Uma2 family endonuclease